MWRAIWMEPLDFDTTSLKCRIQFKCLALKLKKAAFWVGMMSVIFGFVAPLTGAGTDEEEKEVRLMDEKDRIDRAAKPATDQEKMDLLAKQFNVSAATIEGLRHKGQGWGEITIALGTA